MGGLTYSGKFEEHINELYSPKNISKTAKKFKQYEKENGPYAFGNLRNFGAEEGKLGHELGATDGHDRWESTPAPFPRRSATRLPKSLQPT